MQTFCSCKLISMTPYTNLITTVLTQMECVWVWRKRSIPTHSEWLYPLTFDAGKGLKEA